MSFTKRHAELVRDILVEIHGTWSANAVVRAMLAFDIGVRRQDALALVRDWLGKGTRGRGFRNDQLELVPQLVPESVPQGVRNQLADADSGAFSGAHIRAGADLNGLSSSSVPTLRSGTGSSSSLRSHEALNSAPAREKIQEPPWAQPLVNAVRDMRQKTLRSLTAKERNVLGQYHALRFGNCTRDEANNKRFGKQVAVGLTTLGQHKIFGDITVAEYVGYARQVHAYGNNTPFFKAWAITAFVEFES